jgi:dTDP-4-dehydrorhamnose reductase
VTFARSHSNQILLTGMSGVFGLGLARSLALADAISASVAPLPGAPDPAQLHVAGRQRPDAWQAVAFGEMDLMQPGALAAWIQQHRPQAVLHAAAMARPAECEQNPSAAWRVNAESAAEAAAACASIGARLVYCSTDQVFDGNADRYAEDAPCNPLQIYGQTKAAAETEVLDAGGVVVRLPLLFGPEASPGHMGADQALLEASRRGESIGLFDDEIRAPADAMLLAAPIWRLLTMTDPIQPASAGTSAVGEPKSGTAGEPKSSTVGGRKFSIFHGRIYHLAGADAVSRHQMGVEVCKAAGIPFEHGRMSVKEWAGAPRPARLVLTCERAVRELNFQPPDLRQSLARVEALRS